MGYILPMRHISYEEYQKRIQSVKKQKIVVHRLYPTQKITAENKFTFLDESGRGNIKDGEIGRNINTYV